jgi:hypothetical protein
MFIPEVDLGSPYSWAAVPRMVRELGPALDTLENDVEQLASEIAQKPSVPVVITKDHVNAVARVMGAGLTSYADGDLALAMAVEEESLEAARNYAHSKMSKDRPRR